MGWFGLHVDPAYGGEGYGLEEVAVVLEELGRCAAPGPFLATMAAAALISAGDSPDAAKKWLPGLADGNIVGAAAFPGSNALSDTGVLRPVLSGGLAHVVVASLGGRNQWCVLPTAAAHVEVLPSLDPTRRVAALTFVGQEIDAADRFTLDDEVAAALIATLVAAECAGAAAWCLDTATEYAKVREQFGRPIGQFQAIKHKCADMLISVEQVRAAAWDVASAMTQDPQSPESLLSASIAASVAPAEFNRVAKDCVQVLGGIGFTWEHDAHRYLRRATTLLSLTGPVPNGAPPPSPWPPPASAAEPAPI